MWEIYKSGSVRDIEVVFAWSNIVTLRRSKERSNREYKANLNEQPYYVYSTRRHQPSKGREE